ncbi:MAG TPA: hypothetical protein VIH10_17850 [Kribbella sp.]
MTNQFDEESDAAKDALGLGDEADELSALKKSGGDVEARKSGGDVEAKSGGDVEAQKSGGDVEVGGETPDSGGDVE